jgi:hypothetical protein
VLSPPDDPSQTKDQDTVTPIDTVFFLFLDAVSQLTKQNPTAFEYTPTYLSWLANQALSNRFFEFVQSPTRSKS